MPSGDSRLNKTLSSPCSFLGNKRALSFVPSSFLPFPFTQSFFSLVGTTGCKLVLPLRPPPSVPPHLARSSLWCSLSQTTHILYFFKKTAGEKKPALHSPDSFFFFCLMTTSSQLLTVNISLWVQVKLSFFFFFFFLPSFSSSWLKSQPDSAETC